MEIREQKLWAVDLLVVESVALLFLPVLQICGEYSVIDLADVVPVALALPVDLCGLLLADDELLELGKMLSLYLRKVLLVVREVVLKLEQGLGAGHLGVGPPAGWLEHD